MLYLWDKPTGNDFFYFSWRHGIDLFDKICISQFKTESSTKYQGYQEKVPLSLPQLEMLLNIIIIIMILKVFDISFTAVSYLQLLQIRNTNATNVQ